MKFLGKKGISPLIATVLLIGFTVALAAVVILWGSGFFSKLTISADEQSTNSLLCATDLKFVVTKVNCGDSITNPVTPGSVTIDNRGTTDIKGVSLRFFDSTGDSTFTTNYDDCGDSTVGCTTTNKGIPTIARLQVKTLKLSALSLPKNLPSKTTKVQVTTTILVGDKNLTCSENVQENKFTACI